MSSARLPLGRAHALASFVANEAQGLGIPVSALVPLGSLRRYAPDIGDVSLLAVAPAAAHDAVLDGFARLTSITTVLQRSASGIAITSPRGPLAIHLTVPEHAGAALLWHTGSRLHTRALQRRALALGLEFSHGRVMRGAILVDAPTEDAVYRLLELPYIAPELRENGGEELDAADQGALPQLVSAPHVRGDLHAHTNWSDGRDTIEQMILAAKDLGYGYFAITDHSERAWASRTLAEVDVPKQREEIAAARDRVGGIEVLHGVEVDILHDGSLDFPDSLLEGFDIVLASLHDDGGHDGARLTERYLRAMRHPLVNIITHPANRTPAASKGYDLDFDRLFAAAVETGTAMEVDGAPGHLDMDGALARRAASSGVTLVIDSDCHRAEALGRQMEFGLGTARRGWVEPRQVLNTRNIDAVRAFVARKRASG